tara:strand:+ start:363 stop:557 length:195 start_codon:yes stop_codon:yes gene_type:complete
MNPSQAVDVLTKFLKMSEEQAWTVAKRYHARKRIINDETKSSTKEQCDSVSNSNEERRSRVAGL